MDAMNRPPATPAAADRRDGPRPDLEQLLTRDLEAWLIAKAAIGKARRGWSPGK